MRYVLWPFKGFLYLIHILPLSVQMFLGDLLGLFWFYILRIRRQTVLANLRLAFPEMPEKDRRRLGAQSMCNIGRALVEYCHLPFLTREKIDEMVEFRNLDKWDRALAKGHGVCALTLHLGNGDFGNAALSLRGYPSHLISKEFKLKWLNDLWFGVRKKHGTQFIPPRNSSYKCLKALNAGEVVIFVLDQFMGPPIGVKTTFFGVETGTALGLAVMAGRTGAPVLPIYTYRQPDGRHVVDCLDEIPFEEASSKVETQRIMTQKYTDVIEQLVRQHPDQWMWIHRRWKRFKQ